jgi:dolichol-phosphate mannosyltransferase
VELLSIIIPVCNEVDNIRPVAEEIDNYVKENYEILFVDDGSSDATYNAIYEQSVRDHRVKCISLSRNFGHQNALMAGIEHATGDYIITMDGDLQHPPALIPQILQNLKEGFDIINTKRVQSENVSAVKKITGRIFYQFINAISDTRIEANVSDFKGFNRKILQSILRFKERDLFLRGIFSWIGFKVLTIEFEAPARKHGSTKYSFSKMLLLALRGTTSFSFKPLRVALLTGTIISLMAFSFGIYALIAHYKGNTVPGWTSLIIAVMFLGGTQLLAIGLLGEYIASLFTETKQRPLYLIDKKINID